MCQLHNYVDKCIQGRGYIISTHAIGLMIQLSVLPIFILARVLKLIVTELH